MSTNKIKEDAAIKLEVAAIEFCHARDQMGECEHLTMLRNKLKVAAHWYARCCRVKGGAYTLPPRHLK